MKSLKEWEKIWEKEREMNGMKKEENKEKWEKKIWERE